MTKHIIGQSIYQLILLLAIVFTGEKWFDIPSGRITDLPEAVEDDPTVHMTIVFNTFVWAQLFNELNCRKIHDEINIFSGITKNRVFLYVCVLQVAMQYVMVQHTGDWFKCSPLTAGQWFACIGMGFISLPLGLALRCVSIKKAPNWMASCREDSTEPLEGAKSQRGRELWIVTIARVLAQLRVVKAFKNALQSKAITEG